MEKRELKFRAWNYGAGVMITWPLMSSPTFNLGVKAGLVYDIVCANATTDGTITMQFTGLFDREGKEIYEGDILSFKSTSIFKAMMGEDLRDCVEAITWNAEKLCWWVGGEDGFQPNLSTDNNQFLIIGNVFEHPHLLTQS